MTEKAALLPVWDLVKKSYQLAWHNRMEYLKISWCWLVLSVPVLIIVGWLQQSSSLYMLYCLDFDQMQQAAKVDPIPGMFFSLLPTLFIIVLGASIAVAWHRLILRNEKVIMPYYLRLDKLVVSYLILVAFLFCIKTLPSFFMAITNNHKLYFVSIIILAIQIIAIVFGIRISVILPSRALGANITIKEGWEKTRSNFWRLCIGDILCFIPSLLIAPAMIAFKVGCGYVFGGVSVYTVTTLLYLIITPPIYLSFLSLSYQHFFERDELESVSA